MSTAVSCCVVFELSASSDLSAHVFAFDVSECGRMVSVGCVDRNVSCQHVCFKLSSGKRNFNSRSSLVLDIPTHPSNRMTKASLLWSMCRRAK